MIYKIGDTVTVQATKPQNEEEYPGWTSQMNLFLGKTFTITNINYKKRICELSHRWWFKAEWLGSDTNFIPLEKRICNKIKELDNKWKERTTRCVSQ